MTSRHFLPAIVALALAVGGTVRAQPTVQRVDDSIVFHGRIDAASAAAFLALATDPAVTRLVITSVGGLVTPALDIADAIHARGLEVEVPQACLSSCANYIFPAGRRKVLGRPGAVGWHGNMAHVLHLQQSGQASWQEPALADARRLARREAEFFRRIGVDGFVCWFAKLPPYAVEDSYWLSVDDMERFGIRDVTVRDPERPRVAADLQPVSVDWARLQAERPVVRLED